MSSLPIFRLKRSLELFVDPPGCDMLAEDVAGRAVRGVATDKLLAVTRCGFSAIGDSDIAVSPCQARRNTRRLRTDTEPLAPIG